MYHYCAENGFLFPYKSRKHHCMSLGLSFAHKLEVMIATSQLLASMYYANTDEAMCRCVLKFYKHCFGEDDCFT